MVFNRKTFYFSVPFMIFGKWQPCAKRGRGHLRRRTEGLFVGEEEKKCSSYFLFFFFESDALFQLFSLFSVSFVSEGRLFLHQEEEEEEERHPTSFPACVLIVDFLLARRSRYARWPCCHYTSLPKTRTGDPPRKF